MRNYKTFICLFILCVLILVGSCTGSKKKLATKIMELHENAKYEQALDQADNFIDRYNNLSFGYIAKGNILSSLYRIEEAIENYKKALQRTPTGARRGVIYENMADNYMQLNSFDDAINSYRIAIEMDEKLFARGMLGISNVYMLTGDMVEALSCYKRARKGLDESEIRLSEAAYANRGWIYMRAAWIAYQLGNNDEALAYAQKGKDLRNNDRARLSYAIFLARIGNQKQAINEFSSVNIHNCSGEDLASFYLLVGDNEKASKYFNLFYEELKTPDQIKFWKLSFKRCAMFPHDDWAKARTQEWFKAKIQE